MLPANSVFSARRVLAMVLCLLVAMGLILVPNLQGGLVYYQNFNSGDGVPAVTPGGGTLALGGAVNTVLFSTTGGIIGGCLDTTANVSTGTAANAGIASTGAAGGTAISGLPNQTGSGPGAMNQLTISFWMKTQAYSSVSTRAGRLVGLGAAGTTDYTGINAIGFAQAGASPSSPTVATSISPGADGLDLTASIGLGNTPLPLDKWIFIAATYDGTSTLGNNSTIQGTATGGASTVNGQFYQGSDTDSATRFDLPFTVTGGDATAASLGELNFGNDALLFLANRPGLSRSFDGWLDEVRIYDSVLSATEIETLRQSALPIPGDFDGDHDVDGADFVAWQTNFPKASNATLAEGDADKDGDVDGADFVVWQTHFPTSAGPGVSSIPEPTAMFLAAFGVIGLVVFHSSRDRSGNHSRK